MHRVTISTDPPRIHAEGSTRAGLIVASVKGLFEAAAIKLPSDGEEANRPFELESGNAQELLLAVLRAAGSSAHANSEAYADVSFSLITDKKAVGAFVGRKVVGPPRLPSVLGIDGEVLKSDDGLWRAVIALGS